MYVEIDAVHKQLTALMNKQSVVSSEVRGIQCMSLDENLDFLKQK